MHKKFKKILVTGGAGYVGSTLIGQLLEKGYKVRVLDMLRFGGHGIMAYFNNENFEFVKGDIRNREDVHGALNDIDIVIHLAAVVGFPACRKYPELSRDINVVGTKVIVEETNGKIPILFASTNSTYGKIIENLCTETTPLNPLSHYGKQKVEAENIVKSNKEFVIYRFTTAFGVSPRLRLDVMPNDFTYRAVAERTLIVYEKDFVRSFIHVGDMGRAFVFALENYEKIKGDIYNVGSNEMNFTKEDICKMLQKKVNFYLHFADVSKDPEQRNYKVSYDKLEKLGFTPQISFEEGIDKLIKAMSVVEIKNPYCEA